MDRSLEPLYSLIPGPLSYVYLWEESDIHIPLAWHAQLVSNGSVFVEISWYPQSYVIPAGPGSLGPVPPGQPDVRMDSVAPAGGPTSLEANQGGTPIQLSYSLQSSRQSSRQPSRAPSLRPSTPSVTRNTPRSLSTPTTISTRISPTSLTDEEARQTLETWIEGSRWYQMDELEPVVGAPGVPTCALQLAEKGQSIYCCFLLVAKGRGGKVLGWKSATDPRSGWDRLHRAVAKERVRRGHRPFGCPRDHDPTCSFHGHSQESLKDHLSLRNISVPCHVCSKSIASKNMQRHLRDMHGLYH